MPKATTRNKTEQGTANQTAPELHFLPPTERLDKFGQHFRDDPQLSAHLPGLGSLLLDEANPDVEVSSNSFMRRLFNVFRDAHNSDESSDKTYANILAKSTDDQVSRLERFMDGAKLEEVGKDFELGPSQGVRSDFDSLRGLRATNLRALHQRGKEQGVDVDESKNTYMHLAEGFTALEARLNGETSEQDMRNVTVYEDAGFENWGRTISNKPRYVCIPETVQGVVEIVKFAKKHDLNVRVSGYRHSWSMLFGRPEGGILISMIGLEMATTYTNPEVLPCHTDPTTELSSIHVMDEANGLVRVGCATTNETFRRWCLLHKKLTLPFNVIMVEITMGGSNAPICHGAGRKHQTLSDLVTSIEYVDCNGIPRTVTTTDGDLLQTASGCFGLMGVVTHITLRLEPMRYALMTPLKLHVLDAIPPPQDPDYLARIPKALYQPRTPSQVAKAVAAFEESAMNDYYAEWFWFPYNDEVWVNCWNTTDDPTGATDYPTKGAIFKQWAEAVLMEAMQHLEVYTGTEDWAPLFQATLISKSAIKALDAGQLIKTPVPNGLHFRRAIQNTRVRDLEVEIPLQPNPKSPTTPSFDLVRRAWWDAILAAYHPTALATCPQRMPLEMRIMGSSTTTLAPQRHNDLGTCSIEILTLQANNPTWQAYSQGVLDVWMSYKDAKGEWLRTRPHWSKEWVSYRVRGASMLRYLKEEAYKEEIVEFRDKLARIGAKHGWTLRDLGRRFSNDMFDVLVFGKGDVGLGSEEGNARAEAEEAETNADAPWQGGEEVAETVEHWVGEKGGWLKPGFEAVERAVAAFVP